MQRASDPFSRAPASLPELYPLNVLRAQAAGRVFWTELAPGEATYVLKAYCSALAWCRRMADPAEAFDPAPAAELCADLASVHLPRDLRGALIVLCRQLTRKRRDPHRIALACLEVGDCAVARGARQTALLWGEAAAVAVPLNPRFAWLAGKLHRTWGNCRDAEHWLFRSFRAAVRIKDKHAQALALNSLGNLFRQTGNYARAAELLKRALQRARRYRERSLEGEILHDLVVLAVITGKYREAERYGALAFERYRDDHPNLTRLACDLAYSWAEQGFFERALDIYRSLLPRFTTPEDRLPSLAAVVRCAGAIGADDLFDRYWAEAWEAAQSLTIEPALASALVDMGKGALSISDWRRASEVLDWAVRSATESGEGDMLAAAEAATECVERHMRLDRAPRHRRENPQAERLAQELRTSLELVHAAREERLSETDRSG